MSEERLTAPQHNAKPAHRRGIRHWWVRERYLLRVEWHLDALVAGRERKRIILSLRDDIDAEQRPLTEVLEELGPPRELAGRFAEGASGPRPNWSIGIIWGGAALLLYWIVFAAYALGMLDVVQSAGLGEAHSTFLGLIDVQAFAGDDGFGIGWGDDAAWVLIPAAVVGSAFLAGSRAWRIFARKR